MTDYDRTFNGEIRDKVIAAARECYTYCQNRPVAEYGCPGCSHSENRDYCFQHMPTDPIALTIMGLADENKDDG